MAITRVSSAIISGTSGTLPTHAENDTILIIAHASTATSPTRPSGWFGAQANTYSASPGVSSGYKIAASSSESSGTWTNAAVLCVIVLRSDTANNFVLPDSLNGTSGTGTSITFVSEGSIHREGYTNLWVVGSALIQNTNSDMTIAPSGMTNLQNFVGGSFSVGLHDTNGNSLSNFNAAAAVGGTSASFRQQCTRVWEQAYPASGGGGGGSSISAHGFQQ